VKKRVSVENLAFGMYIAELDRPWAGTPFLFQGFFLRTQAQLDAVRQHCRAVYIDPERGLDSGEHGPVLLSPSAAAPAFGLRGDASHPVASNVEAEFSRARAVHESAGAVMGDVYRALRIQATIDNRQVRDAVAAMTDSLLRMPDALTLASRLSAKSSHLLTRSLNCSIYMIVFGRFLGHPREQLELMGLVGLLQDVGKLNLPRALLEKKGPYSAREVELVRTHVTQSETILRSCEGLSPRVAELALLHHERQDGSGYPRGLKGSQIGLIGSMAAIVDAFDAMTSPRPFPVQLAVTPAYGVLYKQRGTTFHAALVEEFCKCFGVFPVGCPVELNTGEVGIVVGQHPTQRLKPRVMVVTDYEGKAQRLHKLLDLSREPKASADEPYRIRRTLEHGAVQVNAAEFLLA